MSSLAPRQTKHSESAERKERDKHRHARDLSLWSCYDGKQCCFKGPRLKNFPRVLEEAHTEHDVPAFMGTELRLNSICQSHKTSQLTSITFLLTSIASDEVLSLTGTRTGFNRH